MLHFIAVSLCYVGLTLTYVGLTLTTESSGYLRIDSSALKPYDYFYHGCAQEQYVNFLLNTYLDAYARNKKLEPSFIKLRHDKALYDGQLSVIEYLRQHGNIRNDHKEPHRSNLLATSPVFASNISTKYMLEDATTFAYRNTNVKAPASASDIVSKYINSQASTSIYLHDTTQAALINTTENFKSYIKNKNNIGVLLRIGIPRTYAKKCAYISREFGIPACVHANHGYGTHEKMRKFLSTYSKSMVGAMHKFCTNSGNLGEMMFPLQTRILLHRRVFKNPGIIDVQAYHDIPHNDLKAYEEKVKEALKSENPSHPLYASTLFPHADASTSEFYYKKDRKQGWFEWLTSSLTG